MAKFSRRRKLSFAAAALLIILGGAELTLRLHDFNFYYNFGADVLGLPLIDLHSIRRVQNRTVEFDPVLFWRFKPSQVLDARGVYRKPVRINGHGFRGPDFTDQKPAGVYRVACLGDSTTFGWSVGDDETYSYFLQSLLGRNAVNCKVEVLNLGVTGYTSFQGRELMELYVRKWRPDLVIFAFGPNDRLPALKSDAEHMRDRTWDIAPLAVFLSRFQLYKLLKAGVVYLENREQGLSLDPKTYIPKLQRKVSPEEFASNVRAVKSICDQIGTDMVLVNVDFPSLPLDYVSLEIEKEAKKNGAPMPPDWETWDAARIHESLARELQIPELDLRKLFAHDLLEIQTGKMEPEKAAALKKAMGDELGKEPWRFLMVDNGHPNDWGHEIIARELEKLILPLSAFRRDCEDTRK
jgi:lysophospholipase L1-like esterase